jgi:hypothetical protein
MDGDEITKRNESMLRWPDGMPLWQKLLCLFGYHRRETRKTGPTHMHPGMKLRDQCGRCNTML